ncbi:DUF7833 domain-containing protein [Bacteroides faecium]|uniref:DUF4373 domain-containing protein n=1 Tax=Bacteroides faecium TaxID=2715212 RepID=A0A6H0KRQ7_9BACE|nr:Lin1244/Lin1753 domain-containing protein [Bacteroides faecium]QIU95721.1 DUF4373 domain-containing protein [Bacteroides faecium]
MKKDQYFNLEVNLLNDDNIAGMMAELDAAQAIGIYVMLLLHLRTKDNYEASCTPLLLKAFARRYELDLAMMEHVLRDYHLFELNEERQTFRAPYLDRVMKRLEEKRRMDTENGKKGGRPKKPVKSSETPASKGQKPNETQERREEEKRGITTVVNNNSNTATMPVAETVAVPVSTSVPATHRMRIRSVDEEGQRPLQPVVPWEISVDRLAGSQLYMELAGQRSGLGWLFLDHQKEVIKLFKAHIRLYGKENELLFYDDVKRYFSNYIAAGSVTCGKLREALLQKLKQQESKNVNRFESMVDGQRTYLGHLIPNDAPPRPDGSAVWDEVRKIWGH